MDRTKKGAIYPSPISPARFPTKTNERSCYKVRFKQRFTSGKIEGLTPEKAVACIDTRHLHTQMSEVSNPFRLHHGCQMVIATFLDRMCLALRA